MQLKGTCTSGEVAMGQVRLMGDLHRRAMPSHASGEVFMGVVWGCTRLGVRSARVTGCGHGRTLGKRAGYVSDMMSRLMQVMVWAAAGREKTRRTGWLLLRAGACCR